MAVTSDPFPEAAGCTRTFDIGVVRVEVARWRFHSSIEAPSEVSLAVVLINVKQNV